MPLNNAINNSVHNRFKGLGLDNPYKLTSTARKGVKPKVFYDFADTVKMSEKALAGLINLTSKTLSNYKVQQKLLEPVYSEHLLKLITLFEKGEAIFGSIDEFNYWLKKPFWNATQTPAEWLITPGGVDLLIKEIEKFAQGYPV